MGLIGQLVAFVVFLIQAVSGLVRRLAGLGRRHRHGDRAWTLAREEAKPTVEAEVADAGEHPAGIHLPAPSIWPVVLAFGLTVLSFGILTHVAFVVFGLLITLLGIAGWIGDLRHG